MAERALPVTAMRSQAAGGVWPLADQDLDLVAVPELRGERQLPAVDDGADAGVADVGVHGIGEVDRRGAARQGDQPALGREAEHLVLEQLELGVLQELFGVVALEQRVDQAAQPDVGVFLAAPRRLPLATAPFA